MKIIHFVIIIWNNCKSFTIIENNANNGNFIYIITTTSNNNDTFVNNLNNIEIKLLLVLIIQ